MSINPNWIPLPRFLLRKNALKMLLKPIKIKNKKVLEVGFGSAEIIKYIASEGAIVTGFDFSEQAFRYAKRRLKDFKHLKKITIQNTDDSIQVESFDVVIVLEVMEHIKDDESAFNKWLSYLKPGGDLIISVPAHMSKWCKNDIWAGHIKRYEKRELIELCENANVNLIKLWNYGYPLTILLDKLLNRSKSDVNEDSNSLEQKIEKTKKSGIDRENNILYRLISNDIVLFPFYILQRIFFNKDFGSAYILHVKKNV